MAVRAFKDRRLGFFAGLKESVQTITAAGAASAAGIATTIRPYGITLVTTTGTGGPHRVMLERPKGVGIHKHVGVKMNSTADVIVVNKTTSDKFWGSTVNSALFSTAAGGKGQGNLHLVSVSTAQWMLLSNGVTLVGTTGLLKKSYGLQNSTN